MNPSNRLEEARKDYDDGRCLYAGGNYIKVLEAHLAEQDREIAEMRERDKQVEIALLATRQQRDDEFNRAEKAGAELEAQIVTYHAKIKGIDELENQVEELRKTCGRGAKAWRDDHRDLTVYIDMLERKIMLQENRLIHIFQDQAWVIEQKE